MGSEMKFLYLKSLVVLILLITINLSYAQENTISRLESAYKNMKDANGSFVQISYIKDLDKTQKFKGRFFIKGDRIRWQYLGEFTQTIYLNKDNLIVYDRAQKQAIKSSFDTKIYGQLPLALLSRIAVLEKDFEVTQRAEDNLLLIPKTKMGNIRKIELTIHDEAFPIKSMKVTDSNENIVKIDFNAVKINTNLRDSIFIFIPKKDDTVLTN